MAREGETPPISGCTVDGLQIVVHTYTAQDGGAASAGDAIDFDFTVWIED